MGTVERQFDRGTRLGERSLRIFAEEIRTARLANGLSQQDVAEAARISRQAYSRIERATDRQLTVLTASRIAAVLGLNVSIRLFPTDAPIRDIGQTKRLAELLAHVASPLRYRTDVPLPRNGERPEYRAWDALVWGRGERTAIELETRLYDIQAQLRAIHLKQRDDLPDHLLLVVADTPRNRRVLAEFADGLLPDLPRLRTANVLKMLHSGAHPPTGLIVL